MHRRQKSKLLLVNTEIERTLENLKKVRIAKKSSYGRARRD